MSSPTTTTTPTPTMPPSPPPPPPTASTTLKRLAKRSILGTRVAAPGDDGKFHPGIIQAMKTCEDRLHGENRYSVRFDGTRHVKEFRETEIIGPGFQTVTSSKLRAGQIVYVTHCNREVQGAVMHHRPNIDQVIIQILNGGPDVKKKLEDVRLLESRKSARLIGQNNTDFSKLADFNIVHERKRMNSETNSDTSATSGRKRRGSETLSDSSGSGDEYNNWSSGSDERSHTPVMSECTAAMVLMNLSFSPRHADSSKQAEEDLAQLQIMQQQTMGEAALNLSSGLGDVGANVMIDGSVSPTSSSGISSLGSSWTTTSSSNLSEEAEALLQLSNLHESDEGIVSDQSSSADPEDANKRFKTEHVRVVYECTWPGCNTKMDICSDIERHIRKRHLNRADPISEEDHDHEEDFYYNETEIPLLCFSPPTHNGHNAYNHGPGQPTPQTLPILADHMDMARPPHENPEYYRHRHPASVSGLPSSSVSFAMSTAAPIAIPMASFSFASNAMGGCSAASAASAGSASSVGSNLATSTGNGKYIRLSPKPFGSSGGSSGGSAGTAAGSSPNKSPVRRPRGDAKKCRKVYGMEHREQWCTQCKWKKACTRFGEGN